MKKEPKSRGRPRSYDPATVLEQAMGAFWRGGYAGTSLDDLTEATGLNRPSLYAGFGDKLELYLKAMQEFQQRASAHFVAALEPRPSDTSFADRIERYLNEAVTLYTSPKRTTPTGCAVITTATAQTLTVPEVGELLSRVLREMDDHVSRCLKAAVANGALPATTDTAALGFLLAASAHSLGIRARAGASRAQLRRLVPALAQALCPPND